MINAKIRALSTSAIHLPMCTMSVLRDKNQIINAKITALSTIVIHLAMCQSATSIALQGVTRLCDEQLLSPSIVIGAGRALQSTRSA